MERDPSSFANLLCKTTFWNFDLKKEKSATLVTIKKSSGSSDLQTYTWAAFGEFKYDFTENPPSVLLCVAIMYVAGFWGIKICKRESVKYFIFIAIAEG